MLLSPSYTMRAFKIKGIKLCMRAKTHSYITMPTTSSPCTAGDGVMSAPSFSAVQFEGFGVWGLFSGAWDMRRKAGRGKLEMGKGGQEEIQTRRKADRTKSRRDGKQTREKEKGRGGIMRGCRLCYIFTGNPARGEGCSPCKIGRSGGQTA